MQIYSEETGKKINGISKEAIEGLKKYPWPGNVRELENNIHTAVVMAKGSVLLPEHFPVLSENNQTVSIDLEQVGEQLQMEGVTAFASSFIQLMETIEKKTQLLVQMDR